MKKILAVCLLISIVQAITAQTKLSGTITDHANGETLTGATVYIPELKTGNNS